MTKEEFENKYGLEVEVSRTNRTCYLIKKGDKEILVCDKGEEDFERLESWIDTIKYKLLDNCTTNMNDK